MSENMQKAIVLGLMMGGLMILYNQFPAYSSVILFSALFGLAFSRT